MNKIIRELADDGEVLSREITNVCSLLELVGSTIELEQGYCGYEAGAIFVVKNYMKNIRATIIHRMEQNIARLQKETGSMQMGQ